jgi:hypothetical protein
MSQQALMPSFQMTHVPSAQNDPEPQSEFWVHSRLMQNPPPQ